MKLQTRQSGRASCKVISTAAVTLYILLFVHSKDVCTLARSFRTVSDLLISELTSKKASPLFFQNRYSPTSVVGKFGGGGGAGGHRGANVFTRSLPWPTGRAGRLSLGIPSTPALGALHFLHVPFSTVSIPSIHMTFWIC